MPFEVGLGMLLTSWWMGFNSAAAHLNAERRKAGMGCLIGSLIEATCERLAAGKSAMFNPCQTFPALQSGKICRQLEGQRHMHLCVWRLGGLGGTAWHSFQSRIGNAKRG